MEIFQLKQFQAVAELEHMTRAAERLNLAQPALSRTIRNLENELGVPLFDRDGRRMRLNENGRILLRYTRQILASLQDARAEIDARKTGTESRIQLCVHSATALLPQLLADFLAVRPEVRFEITQRIFGETEQPSYDMLIDSLVGDEVLPRNSCLLLREDVVLAAAADHPLTRLSPRVVAESDNPITLCDFVRCGVGVCFLPSRTGLPPQTDGIALLHLQDFAHVRQLYLHWRYSAYLPPHIAAFRDFCVRWFASLAPADRPQA